MMPTLQPRHWAPIGPSSPTLDPYQESNSGWKGGGSPRPQALARWVEEIGKWGGGVGPAGGVLRMEGVPRASMVGSFSQALSALAWPLDMAPVLLPPPVLARQDACIFN